MGVIGPNQHRLFCEGKPDSLDYLVLRRLCGAEFLLQPTGSKNGLFNFIDGFTSNNPQSGGLIAFRDRDFDAEPDETAVKLLPVTSSSKLKIVMSHRTCIENYLLDPTLIHRYWEGKSQGPKWTHGAPPSIDILAQWIEKAARDIADYQAIRWALTKLRPGARWPNVRNTWVRQSGTLPANLDYETCLASALDLVKEFRCSLLPVNHKVLKRAADDYRQRFRDPRFWTAKAYLIWFQGKDIKKAMNRAQQGWLSLDGFFEWAAQNFDWQVHQDLLELEQILSSFKSA